jgi:predicted Rossmann-fold nucleotide-binding protein
LGTVEEILYVLDLIDRNPEFEEKKLVIFIFNRSGFWEKSGLLNMLVSAGYEEGKFFHVIEDIEELKPIVKGILEKKYEGQKTQEKVLKK